MKLVYNVIWQTSLASIRKLFFSPFSLCLPLYPSLPPSLPPSLRLLNTRWMFKELNVCPRRRKRYWPAPKSAESTGHLEAPLERPQWECMAIQINPCVPLPHKNKVIDDLLPQLKHYFDWTSKSSFRLVCYLEVHFPAPCTLRVLLTSPMDRTRRV